MDFIESVSERSSSSSELHDIVDIDLLAINVVRIYSIGLIVEYDNRDSA